MKKKITIIGAGGNMGRWFTKYFLDNNFDVVGYDPENQITNQYAIKSQSLISSVLNTDYVILCTPIRKTPEIIRLVSKEMKKGTYLIDISSQKSKTVSALSKVPSKINPICIHPMFGPGIKNINGQNIISIPIKDAQNELHVAKSLFPLAKFVTIDAIEHDKKISIILGLTHLINLIFANILSKDEKISLTNKMSGTTFKTQKIICESVMNESPELIETIVTNPEIKKFSEEFWKDLGHIITYIQEGKTDDIINYIQSCKKRLSKNVNLDNSYQILLSIVDLIETK
ncbi:MAG: prephenate dehydrogenase/arogenate dehydrogenase family protein [Thaumarchaeota archaeon]|nr:prephenate dehydrogenase/arogenate dehydrogenase family protein [Nitrososphaerota archaeon]MCY3975760.1 prephenate dehydrogenase/arogenate dehydrogenase family protein [Nitrososphaerota archaeon]